MLKPGSKCTASFWTSCEHWEDLHRQRRSEQDYCNQALWSRRHVLQECCGIDMADGLHTLWLEKPVDHIQHVTLYGKDVSKVRLRLLFYESPQEQRHEGWERELLPKDDFNPTPTLLFCLTVHLVINIRQARPPQQGLKLQRASNIQLCIISVLVML